MNIKKWTGIKKQYKLYVKGVNNMDNVIKRPCSILESIKESLEEIRQAKMTGKTFKSLEDSMKMWDNWTKDIDNKNE